MKRNKANVADFPYQSNYVKVLGSNIHYIDEGAGDVCLFLHGIPTSSYLWRNVIPHVSDHARCIALDLVGMGKSDKPDISYRIFDYIQYVEGFVDALKLKNVTLVMHGWGSAIGFDYAMRHEHNVKSLVFMEAHLRPEYQQDMISLPVQQLYARLKSANNGFDLVVNSNHFLDTVFPSGMVGKLSDDEMDNYRAPFQSPEHRQLLWQYLQDLPVGVGQTADDVLHLMGQYSNKLVSSSIPKLMFYAIPGFHTTVDSIIWARDNLKNLTLVDLGEGMHYMQECMPDVIGTHLANWCLKL